MIWVHDKKKLYFLNKILFLLFVYLFLAKQFFLYVRNLIFQTKPYPKQLSIKKQKK